MFALGRKSGLFEIERQLLSLSRVERLDWLQRAKLLMEWLMPQSAAVPTTAKADQIHGEKVA